MRTATGMWPIVLAVAGAFCVPGLAQNARPPSPTTPAAAAAPAAAPLPLPAATPAATRPATPAASPAAPPPAAPPATPPAAPPAGEGSDSISIRIRDLQPAAPRVEYDGALMRIRQRAQRHSPVPARNSEEAKWQQGIDNVSFDSMTHRPMGVYFFVVRY